MKVLLLKLAHHGNLLHTSLNVHTHLQWRENTLTQWYFFKAFAAGGELRRSLTTNLRNASLSSSARDVSMPMIENSRSTQNTHETEEDSSA